MTTSAISNAVDWRRIDSFVGNSTSPELTTDRPCPVCGAGAGATVWRLDDFQYFSDSASLPKRVDLRVAQCGRCFALYLDPCFTSEGFGILFAEAEQSYGATAGRHVEQIEWMGARGLLEPGAEVLDIGCYDGRFLAELPPSLRRVGLDIDEAAIERGRALHGEHAIEFVLGDFETFAYAGAPDTMTMFHVLEHLPNPVGALRKLRSIAHPGCRLVVEVPILEHGLTNDVNGFFSPQHMTHFSRRSLANCLRRAGWTPLDWLEQRDYNGCRVVAGPAAAEDAEGTPEDVANLHRYLAHWHGAVARVGEALAPVLDVPRLAVWGAGLHTEILYHVTPLFRARPDRQLLLVDNDPLKQGKTWRGVEIRPSSVLADVGDPVVLVSSYGNQEAIAADCLERAPAARIVTLYDRFRLY